ncbi:MAG TPA: type II and III secretion system protein family protein [Xanthobacteraceae bacterium]|nr:type II and III secretion system protein family protein [Xanthobacteraceae bacterium]
MTNGNLATRCPWILAGLIASGVLAGEPVLAADADGTPASRVRVTTAEAGAKFIPLGIGKSVVIDLPRDAKDVLVANPAIANAVVRSTRRAYLIGVGVGQTNVFFFDENGGQIAAFDIAVTRDLNGLQEGLRKIAPTAAIHVEGLGTDGVVLTGSAASPEEAQQAFDLAVRLVGDPAKVVNQIAIRDRDQVMLKVTVAEVQRDVIKQLGINLNGSLGIGSNVVNFNTDNPFTAYGRALSSSGATAGFVDGLNQNPLTGAFRTTDPSGNNPLFKNTLQATLRAMEQAGVIRTLAEPNLTAISGESATFLAGGEFPVPGGYTCDSSVPPVCQLQIQWKKFGVGLNFTPVVLAEGRISLKVMTEVSELSPENAIVLQPTSQAAPINIPSIKTRRAETTVEIPSGGSLAMAGMIQEQTKQAINGTPGLMQVPILGALFKSRDFVNRQTELMVLVTPYVVKSVARKKLSRPDDNYADASDPQGNLLGKFNRIYGKVRKVNQPYHGSYGFILD